MRNERRSIVSRAFETSQGSLSFSRSLQRANAEALKGKSQGALSISVGDEAKVGDESDPLLSLVKGYRKEGPAGETANDRLKDTRKRLVRSSTAFRALITWFQSLGDLETYRRNDF